eukprot:gene22450-biopygen23730
MNTFYYKSVFFSSRRNNGSIEAPQKASGGTGAKLRAVRGERAGTGSPARSEVFMDRNRRGRGLQGPLERRWAGREQGGGGGFFCIPASGGNLPRYLLLSYRDANRHARALRARK